MTMRLPDFSNPLLQALYVCATSERGSLPVGHSLPNGMPLKLESRYPIGDEAATIRLILEDWGSNTIHFHVNVAREFALPDSEDFKVVQLDHVLGIIGGLYGFRANAWIGSEFAIDFSELPVRGIIASLLGLSTEACGDQMQLTGAAMKIESDTFSKVEWSIDDDSCVQVKIDAGGLCDVDDDYLTNFAAIVLNGLDRFVFESPPDKTQHGEHLQSTAMPKKELG